MLITLLLIFLYAAGKQAAAIYTGTVNFARAWYDIEKTYPKIKRSALRARFEEVSGRRLPDWLFFDYEDM